jgi:hypothetical protein
MHLVFNARKAGKRHEVAIFFHPRGKMKKNAFFVLKKIFLKKNNQDGFVLDAEQHMFSGIGSPTEFDLNPKRFKRNLSVIRDIL